METKDWQSKILIYTRQDDYRDGMCGMNTEL